jgi:serine-type D-Ala-D-Ala carboxypeptidase (penicillin-binding protein 5/6)
MSRELITKYPEVTKYTTTWQDTITHTTKKGTTEFGLTNTNKLLKWYNNATGLKTGSTGKALYCLSATAKKDGMELIAVIMAAPDPKLRFREAIQLLDFGFANYKLIHGKKVGEEITDVPIYKGEKDSVKAVVQREFTTLANKGSKAELTTKTEIIPSVQAPVAKGTKLGELVYYIGNKEMGRVNLISKDAVNKANLGTMFQRLTYLWFR